MSLRFSYVFYAISMLLIVPLLHGGIQVQWRYGYSRPTLNTELKSGGFDSEVQVSQTILPICSLWGNYHCAHKNRTDQGDINVRVRPVSVGCNLILPISTTPFSLYVGIGGSYIMPKIYEDSHDAKLNGLILGQMIKKRVGSVFKSGITITCIPLFVDIFCDYYSSNADPTTLRVGIGVGLTF